MNDSATNSPILESTIDVGTTGHYKNTSFTVSSYQARQHTSGDYKRWELRLSAGREGLLCLFQSQYAFLTKLDYYLLGSQLRSQANSYSYEQFSDIPLGKHLEYDGHIFIATYKHVSVVESHAKNSYAHLLSNQYSVIEYISGRRVLHLDYSLGTPPKCYEGEYIELDDLQLSTGTIPRLTEATEPLIKLCPQCSQQLWIPHQKNLYTICQHCHTHIDLEPASERNLPHEHYPFVWQIGEDIQLDQLTYKIMNAMAFKVSSDSEAWTEYTLLSPEQPLTYLAHQAGRWVVKRRLMNELPSPTNAMSDELTLARQTYRNTEPVIAQELIGAQGSFFNPVTLGQQRLMSYYRHKDTGMSLEQEQHADTLIWRLTTPLNQEQQQTLNLTTQHEETVTPSVSIPTETQAQDTLTFGQPIPLVYHSSEPIFAHDTSEEEHPQLSSPENSQNIPESEPPDSQEYSAHIQNEKDLKPIEAHKAQLSNIVPTNNALSPNTTNTINDASLFGLYSPIKIGTTGSYDSQKFVVIGHINYEDDGIEHINWYIRFDNGNDGRLFQTSRNYNEFVILQALVEAKTPASRTGASQAPNKILTPEQYPLDATLVWQDGRFIAYQREYPKLIKAHFTDNAQQDFIPEVCTYFSRENKVLKIEVTKKNRLTVFAGQRISKYRLNLANTKPSHQLQLASILYFDTCSHCYRDNPVIAGFSKRSICPQCFKETNYHQLTASISVAHSPPASNDCTVTIGQSLHINNKRYTVTSISGLQKLNDVATISSYIITAFHDIDGFSYFVMRDKQWWRMESTHLSTDQHNQITNSIQVNSNVYQQVHPAQQAKITFSLGLMNKELYPYDDFTITDYVESAGTFQNILRKKASKNKIEWALLKQLYPAEVAYLLEGKSAKNSTISDDQRKNSSVLRHQDSPYTPPVSTNTGYHQYNQNSEDTNDSGSRKDTFLSRYQKKHGDLETFRLLMIISVSALALFIYLLSQGELFFVLLLIVGIVLFIKFVLGAQK